MYGRDERGDGRKEAKEYTRGRRNEQGKVRN
jgi:hypothetical protein